MEQGFELAGPRLVQILLDKGQLAQVMDVAERMAMYWEFSDPRRCAMVLESLAETDGAEGQRERAARLLGAATALRERLGTPLLAHSQAELEQAVAGVLMARAKRRGRQSTLRAGQ